MPPTSMYALRSAAAAAVLPTDAACGTQEPGGTATEPEPTEAAPDEEVLVSCGGEAPGWPVSAMETGIDADADADEIRAALDALVTEAGIDAPAGLRTAVPGQAAWIVLAESSDVLTLGVGPWSAEGPGEGAGQLQLGRTEGGQWRALGWGDCRLAPILDDDLQWATVDPPAEGLDRASTTLTVLISERACTSSRDPGPHLREPTGTETGDSVTISWTSRMSAGGHCAGNPRVERTVELREPLGDRALLDGSSWPPRQVRP